MQQNLAANDGTAPLATAPLATAVPDAGLPAAGTLGPRNPLEQLVAEIWCETLVVDQVGIRDDFFALGGESLDAAQILVEIHDRIGVELQVRELFENPTVERTAALVAAALEARQGGGAPERS